MTERTPKELIELAVAYMKQGQPKIAANLCCQLLDVLPDFEPALHVLARAQHMQYRMAPTLMHGYFRRIQAQGFVPTGMLDIGAYRGAWTRMARDVFPDVPVLMLDAQQESAAVLDGVVGELGAGVAYEIVLLGEQEKSAVPFYRVEGNGHTTGSSVFEEQTHFARQVMHLPMRTLDAVIADHPVPYSVIKLDVQGSELNVLRGGEAALQRAEVVMMEVSLLQYNSGAPLAKEVLAFMHARGFVLHDFVGEHRLKNGTLFQTDMVFVREHSPLRPTGILEL